MLFLAAQTEEPSNMPMQPDGRFAVAADRQQPWVDEHMPSDSVRIHVVPGVDARAAARDLLRAGVVGIDDIGEGTHEMIRDEILDHLGHAGDELDLRTQRIDTPFGPVFVYRDAAVWSEQAVRQAVLASRGVTDEGRT